MDEQIEKPVRHHHRPGDQGNLAVAQDAPDQPGEQAGDDQRSHQAVRVGHMVEVQRVHRADAGGEAELFIPAQNQGEENPVNQLRGDEQGGDSR